MSNFPAPVVTSAYQFKAIALDNTQWPDDADAMEAFAEWLQEESENWLTFDEWEAFCMAHGLA